MKVKRQVDTPDVKVPDGATRATAAPHPAEGRTSAGSSSPVVLLILLLLLVVVVKEHRRRRFLWTSAERHLELEGAELGAAALADGTQLLPRSGMPLQQMEQACLPLRLLSTFTCSSRRLPMRPPDAS